MVSPPNSSVSLMRVNRVSCKVFRMKEKIAASQVGRNRCEISAASWRGRSVSCGSRSGVSEPRSPSILGASRTFVAAVAGITGPTALRTEVEEAILPALARSTWGARASMWRRLEQAGDTTPTAAVSFLARMEVTIQSKLTYAKSLKATFTQMGIPCRPVEMYITALLAQGAAVPVHQALAIKRSQVMKLVGSLSKDEAAMVTLVWKAVSRWSEAAGLTKANFIKVSPTEVIISWGQGTKSSRLNPYRESMFTVLVGPGTERVFHRIRQMKGDEPFCRLSTDQMNAILKRKLGAGYTTHGFKHGAVETLMEEVEKGTLTLEDVMKIAKHQQLETTLRYAGNVEATARALNTQKVTVLLKC